MGVVPLLYAIRLDAGGDWKGLNDSIATVNKDFTFESEALPFTVAHINLVDLNWTVKPKPYFG